MNLFFKKINNLIYKFLYKVIVIYQKVISPVIPARCRYYPTCSDYGKQALSWHGTRHGSWLLLKRISRCHPLGGHGIDFVPLPLSSYHYHYLPSTASTQHTMANTSVYRDKYSYGSRLNHLMKF